MSLYLCTFFWGWKPRFSKTRELDRPRSLEVLCIVTDIVNFVHFFFRPKLFKNCTCLVEVHEKNAGFWSDSQYTCQIYFAFLKKLYYLYSFSKSVAFLSMIPKANILKERVIDFTTENLKLLSAKIYYKQDWKASDNWEQWLQDIWWTKGWKSFL